MNASFAFEGGEATPQPFWTGLQGRIGHRLSIHLRQTPFRIPKTQPMMTLTFDDVPQSALDSGASLLADHGVKGTFYVCGGLVGTNTPFWRVATADEIAKLHASGHEIGCHTYGHLRADETDADEIVRDVERNRAFLHEIDPTIRAESFAYPFGFGALNCKRRLATQFVSGRGIIPSVNAGDIDLQFLRAFPLIDRQMTPSGIERALDRAVATGGWAIFYTHDVATRPSPWGCSPALLEYALVAAERRGIATVTMRDALRRIGATHDA